MLPRVSLLNRMSNVLFMLKKDYHKMFKASTTFLNFLDPRECSNSLQCNLQYS